MIVREALLSAPFTMKELARDARISYDTLRSWRGGVRVPGPRSAKQLARGLRKRAARLTALAEKLEREAER